MFSGASLLFLGYLLCYYSIVRKPKQKEPAKDFKKRPAFIVPNNKDQLELTEKVRHIKRHGKIEKE